MAVSILAWAPPPLVVDAQDATRSYANSSRVQTKEVVVLAPTYPMFSQLECSIRNGDIENGVCFSSNC
jgi:hypothetical protein